MEETSQLDTDIPIEEHTCRMILIGFGQAEGEVSGDKPKKQLIELSSELL